MVVDRIVQGVNDELAGELLTYDALKIHLDTVIDEINSALNAKFPVFSEFDIYRYPERYPDYNFFPDRFIRTVVIKGAAYKFYITDEEGMQTANQYGYDYKNAMFLMIRDYIDKVPAEFCEDENGELYSTGAITSQNEQRILDFNRDW